MFLVFLSTHPCGVRPRVPEVLRNILTISIHAPLRGATRDRLRDRIGNGFLSTHPCGVRHGSGSLKDPMADFYPRTPAGCDIFRAASSQVLHRFLSTHPCGVRPKALSLSPSEPKISIHAPLRGATAIRQLMDLVADISIHAPLRGATVLSDGYVRSTQVFLSTHPCGVRPRCYAITDLDVLFLSTHPCGVRL